MSEPFQHATVALLISSCQTFQEVMADSWRLSISPKLERRADSVYRDGPGGSQSPGGGKVRLIPYT